MSLVKFFFFIIGSSFCTAATTNGAVNSSSLDRIDSGAKLLSYSKKHSLEYQKIRYQLEIDQINADSLLSLYRWKLTGSLNVADGEQPQTNPFAPAGESSSVNSNIQIERQTSLGITPYAAFNATSAKSAFNLNGTPINNSFKNASIEVGARFDIMRLVFTKNSGFVFAEFETRQKISEVSKRVSERTFEKSLLQAHFNAIKANRRREILNGQCAQYNKLRSITRSRFRKKLLREKDYLLVEVLYKQCLLDLEGARNDYRLSLEELKKASGLFTQSFDYTRVIYPNILPALNLNTGKNYDLALSELVFKASESVSKNAASKKLPELNFQLALKSQGADASSNPNYSEAFNQAAEGDFLTTELGLNFSHSFGGSQSQLESKKSVIQSYIDRTSLEQLKQSLKRDTIRLGLNLGYFDDAFRKVKEIEKLQKRKSVVFNKDFQNGRVTLRDLVEAEIAYLTSLQNSLNLQDLRVRAYLEAYDLSGESFEKFY